MALTVQVSPTEKPFNTLYSVCKRRERNIVHTDAEHRRTANWQGHPQVYVRVRVRVRIRGRVRVRVQQTGRDVARCMCVSCSSVKASSNRR